MLNQVWGIVPHVLVIYLVGVDHSILTMDPNLPSFKTTIAIDFALGVISREISFYYIHRAMHHKYTEPISFSAEYAHPVEHIVVNVLPVVASLAI